MRMTREERLRELLAIRAEPDGIEQLAALYELDIQLVKDHVLPDDIVDALVEKLLDSDFPPDGA